ncbi:phage tail protein [Sorangium sp. So ce128]|uniref:phage tail protein n=1 Tax=Sorangium sp. So ce128 TaxID=3133281 RepID=UPI003F6413A8
MKDVNGTRYHLLLGQDDWGVPGTESSPLTSDRVVWNGARNEVSLRAKTFRFRTGRSDRIPSVSDHRGAAMDHYGNWYWIDPSERAIVVTSSGSRETATFWPVPAEARAERETGAFGPAAPDAAPPRWRLSGLAVTDDHYLVVGAHGDDGSVRLLVFDLFGGGEPIQMLWPSALPLRIRDMALAPQGGLWILDRGDPDRGVEGRYWRLDRHLRVVRRASSTASAPGGFSPSTPAPASSEQSVEPARPVDASDAFDALSGDPIAIEGLPDGSVMVLDHGGPESRVRLIRHMTSGGAVTSAQVAELSISRFQELLWEGTRDEAMGSPGDVPELTPHAFDVAFVPDAGCPWPWTGDVFLTSSHGNQAFRVRLEVDRPAGALPDAPDAPPPVRLVAHTDYVPMRLHAGLGLVTAAGRVHYDSGGRWIPLVIQQRPRFEAEGEIETRSFDSREPGCVWHKLDLDGAIPGGASVEVWSRANDEQDALALGAWQREPAFTYRRRDGSELPFVPQGKREGEGTWEVLLQNARGRYLQLRLRLSGDGVRSPSLRALRVWYPRFSYRDRYLPGVYRDHDVSGFLERFMANFEGTFTAIEGRIAAGQMLFDVRSCPPDALDWLASWFGVLLDPTWDDRRRRLFIRHAMQFFQMRGTVRGLRAAVALATSECVDERLFSDEGADAYGPFGVRVVEQFRAREFPGALLGDASGRDPEETLVVVDPGEPWKPSDGLGALLERYGLFLDRWRRGEPSDGPRRAGEPEAPIPETFPTRARDGDADADAWRAFVRGVLALPDLPDGVDEPGWRGYLESRYRSIDALRAAHGTGVAGFGAVMYPDPLAGNARLLDDWYRYESAVRPTRRTAHRFTVLVPVPPGGAADEAALRERLRVAERVVALEKPAHTTFNVMFYWAMFRVGRARLGHDTLVDLGGRAPDLLPPAVAGRSYLAQAYVATALPDGAVDRRRISESTLQKVQGVSQETSA